MSKPLGLYFSTCPQVGVTYKASFATNPWQGIRLWLARRFLRIGYRLLLNNGEVRIDTSLK